MVFTYSNRLINVNKYFAIILMWIVLHFVTGSATISNDGATIMKLLDIVHPAARTLVDIAKSQDAEVSMFVLTAST